MRRVFGGDKYRVMFYVIPRIWPTVIMEPQGAAIYRKGQTDGPVVGNQPVRPGEVLTMKVKGLGPTNPGPTPAGPVPPGTRPFASQPPWDEVSAPIDVTINGVDAEVINAIGWPGTLDTYRVDFRVPESVTPGRANMRVTAAWIPSDEVALTIR